LRKPVTSSPDVPARQLLRLAESDPNLKVRAAAERMLRTTRLSAAR
jgi:hypothetical protein